MIYIVPYSVKAEGCWNTGFKTSVGVKLWQHHILQIYPIGQCFRPFSVVPLRDGVTIYVNKPPTSQVKSSRTPTVTTSSNPVRFVRPAGRPFKGKNLLQYGGTQKQAETELWLTNAACSQDGFLFWNTSPINFSLGDSYWGMGVETACRAWETASHSLVKGKGSGNHFPLFGLLYIPKQKWAH